VNARGLGWSLPLATFDVSLVLGERAQLLASRESNEETPRWTFQALKPAAGYVAAIVVEGSSRRIQYGCLHTFNELTGFA